MLLNDRRIQGKAGQTQVMLPATRDLATGGTPPEDAGGIGKEKG